MEASTAGLRVLWRPRLRVCASWQAGEWGQHCRFCGFESDGAKYPPCPDSHKGASAEPQPIQRQHSASRTERLSASHAQNEAVELTNLNDLIRFV